MHRLFQEQNDEQVTFSLYYSVFMFDFNLAFGHPAKDVCSTCMKYRIQMRNPDLSANDRREKTALYIVHRRRARQFYESMQQVQNTYTVCFDVMENLVLPKSAIGQTFYSRQLYMYVFCVVRHRGQGQEQSRDDIHLYVWQEHENKKDSNMIASALNHYFNIVGNDIVTHRMLRLFSDSCYGQNKNINVLAMLFALRATLLPDTKIEYTFPVRGHSFLPADRVFGRLEQEIRRKPTIFLPSEYIEIMRVHGTVHVYGADWNCYDYKTAATKHCSSSRSFKISEAKVLEINREKLGFMASCHGDFCTHSVLKRGKKWDGFQPTIMNNINCVKPAKKKDVMNLITELGVQDNVRQFYETAFEGVGRLPVGRQDLEESSDDDS